MRVSRRARRDHGERGAVAVIVAICSTALFAMAAFAIDAGNAWQSRRHLINATDAAALAAAQEYALGGNGCGGVDDSFVVKNDPDASVTGCVPNLGTGKGRVTVNASTPVDFAFADVIGIANTTVTSSTTSRYGIPSGVKSLRPLALCNASVGFQAWITSGMVNPYVATILYNKDHPNACGNNAPGNWGVADLDGGANSNSDTKDWLANGYPGLINTGQWVEGDTGAFSNSLNSELATLKSQGTLFFVPVFDQVTGNGANANLHIVGFAGVKLLDYKTTGPEAARYLTVSFQTGIAQGTCCASGPDNGVRVVGICAVDPNFDTSNC